MLTKVDADIEKGLQDIGVKARFLVISGLRNSDSDPEFQALAEREIEGIRATLSAESIANDPIIQGFRELHTKVGVSNRKNISASENLLCTLLRTGRIPHVNLLVDIYNLVSAKTGLSLGAHDTEKIAGNVHLRFTNGDEHFFPIGASEPKAVKPEEYAYVDDANDVICRLEVRQVEKTKVTTDTTDCFYIIQGNAATSEEQLDSAVDLLISLTTRYCGGRVV